MNTEVPGPTVTLAEVKVKRLIDAVKTLIETGLADEVAERHKDEVVYLTLEHARDFKQLLRDKVEAAERSVDTTSSAGLPQRQFAEKIRTSLPFDGDNCTTRSFRRV